MIALATLDLLGEAAAQAPVLLVADDAQWLDPPTLDVLTFIARRLGREPLGMLLAIREGHPTCLDTLALREFRLHPLTTIAAGALLDIRSSATATDSSRRPVAAALCQVRRSD
jgi:hypothetical protein